MRALLRNMSLLGLWLMVMATFTQPSSAQQIEMFLETPAEGERVASVLFIRGWATAPSGIDHVDLVINGVSPLGTTPFRIPFGESRPDVKALFPSYPGSASSGFNVGFFFTNSAYFLGSNTITVTAYDKNSVSRSVSHVFDLRRFETSAPKNFYRTFGSTGRFSIATAQIEGDSIFIRDAIIDNQTYDLRLKFNPTLQSFTNYDILKVAGPPTINIAMGQWGKVDRKADCLNVSKDRTKLTAAGSQCPEGASLYLVLDAGSITSALSIIK